MKFQMIAVAKSQFYDDMKKTLDEYENLQW